jgi:hypothetical protein
MSRQHVLTCIEAGLVPLLEGPPGSGKTAVLGALAKEMKMDFLPIVMSVMEPIDPMGLPTVDKGKARFLAFGVFEKVYTAKKPLLVLLDDLGQAVASVQSAVMALIWSGELNGHKVPSCVRFCIATNRPKDRAGVSQVISPIRGRTVTIPWTTSCTCSGYTLCDWHAWAADANIHPAVSAFVKFRPACLAEYDEPGVNHQTVICSPRAMEYLSKAEEAGIHDPALDLIQGIIGAKYATEYLAFRTMFQSLPLIDQIIAKPQTAPVPVQVDQQIAIGSMLSHNITRRNACQAMAYIQRLPVEIAVASVMGARRRVPEIAECKAYVTWAQQSAPHLLA